MKAFAQLRTLAEVEEEAQAGVKAEKNARLIAKSIPMNAV